MRIAIAGGSGFIGREVFKSMKNRGWKPVIFTRKKILNEEGEYVTTDYSQNDINSKLIGFDAVVFLAGVRGGKGKISDFHQNEIVVQRILESCVLNDIKNICFISSIAVYSDTNMIPWNENMTTCPKTFYAVSKLACENIGNIYSKRHGLKFKSLRVAQVLGEGEIKGMMNTFIDNAFNKRLLMINGKSIAKREYIYVKDVAEAICVAILNKEINGCFNIGSGISYTNYEIAKIVNEIFENEGNIQYDDNLDEGIESSLMDNSYAKDKLGFYPKYTFRQALEDIKKIKEAHEIRRENNV